MLKEEMSQEMLEEIKFLTNPDNCYNCQECPQNMGASDWQSRLPCGQWHCWVVLHTQDR